MEVEKNANLKLSGYTPNMLYPEHEKKVALGNLTMVKKSKFEIVKKNLFLIWESKKPYIGYVFISFLRVFSSKLRNGFRPRRLRNMSESLQIIDDEFKS